MQYCPFDPFFRRALILVFVGVFLYTVFLMRSVIAPFFVAFVFAYMLNPIVTLLSRIMHRMLAILVVYVAGAIFAGALLTWLVPVLWAQAQLAWESIPVAVQWYNKVGRVWIGQQMGSLPMRLELDTLSNAIIMYLQDNYQVSDAQSFIKQALSSGVNVANNIGLVVMVPILTFYFLINWQARLHTWHNAIPKPYQSKLATIAKDCDHALMSFVKGQLSVMLLLGFIYAIQLQLIGLQLGLIIGISAGIASFVPYLGFGLGILAALVAGLFQFGLDPIYLGLIVGAFMVGQAMEGYVLQPLLLGDKIGLSALWVIFAVLAGASLFGFVGMLIALPVSAVLNVLFQHAYATYLKSDVYQGAKQLSLWR